VEWCGSKCCVTHTTGLWRRLSLYTTMMQPAGDGRGSAQARWAESSSARTSAHTVRTQDDALYRARLKRRITIRFRGRLISRGQYTPSTNAPGESWRCRGRDFYCDNQFKTAMLFFPNRKPVTGFLRGLLCLRHAFEAGNISGACFRVSGAVSDTRLS